ncbi:uncharacterized protein sh2d7 [Polymixia lowei]
MEAMAAMAAPDLQLETPEGGLKDLVQRWFTETQASLILDNGNFPGWFKGFTARKEAEDLLRDKTLGCFLIRLSDKAIGYILSYKGQDRCRHFVINQNEAGLLIISGDCQTHRSLTELIEHYKVSPIQPFGEYLTSCCYEDNTGELYDVVRVEAKQMSGVSVQALRSLWDHRSDHNRDHRSDHNRDHRSDHNRDHRSDHNRDHRSERRSNQELQLQQIPPAVPPPTLPPKSKTRKLTGTVSVGTMCLSQAVPPVPKRGIPLSHSLSGCLPDKTSQHDHVDHNRTETQRGTMSPAHMDDGISLKRGEELLSFNDTDTRYHGDINHPTGDMYSELALVENRSKSLPRLDKDMEDEYSNQLSTPSLIASTSNSPTPSKRVTCHTYSLHDPRDSMRQHSKSDYQSDRLDLLKSNPLYQTSGGLEGSPAQQGDSMYAEVPQAPAGPSHSVTDDTYEQIPGERPPIQANTYETLEDMKTKQSKSTWGKNNIKWRKFLPDYKKK